MERRGDKRKGKPKPGDDHFDCAHDCSFFHQSPSNTELGTMPDSICRVIQELSILFDVARTLQDGADLSSVLQNALRGMAESLELYRGTLRILNRATNQSLVEAKCGFSSDKVRPNMDAIDERISRKVSEQGEALIIPNVATPQRFLLASELHDIPKICLSSESLAFICVPVAHGGQVMGTLSVTSRSADHASLEADLRLLTLIAQLIAQAVKLRQQAHEQLEHYRIENEKLQEQIKNHFRPDNMIGNSRAMQTVHHSIEQVAVQQLDRPDPRRKRRRQGTRRPRHPRPQPAGREIVRENQLRRAARRHRGKRTLRPRARRLHRSHRHAQRPLRTRPPRHDFPR